MKKFDTSHVQYNFWIEDAQLEELKRIAKEKKMSVSNLIRTMISESLKNEIDEK
jgi:predicted DNA-binding ribbon-helix-helix protein